MHCSNNVFLLIFSLSDFYDSVHLRIRNQLYLEGDESPNSGGSTGDPQGVWSTSVTPALENQRRNFLILLIPARVIAK